MNEYLTKQKAEATPTEQKKMTDTHSKAIQPSNLVLQQNQEGDREDNPSLETEVPLEVRVERANQLLAV